MFNIGEKIHSATTGRMYEITWASDKVSQAEVGTASTPSEGNAFFIKRLVNPKYPLDSAPGSPRMKELRRAECDAFFNKYSRLYENVRRGCGSSGACVPIIDFFREGAFYYTVYPKIDATSLSLADISRLPLLTKLRLIQRIVQGLLPLHVQGIVHSDLKPDNILVQKDGDDWRIRLIDMNDCYSAGEPNAPGNVLGTSDYYSPELREYNAYEIDDPEDEDEMRRVADMARTLTLKSDIFALGIIFHEYLSGNRPIITDEDMKYVCEAAQAGKLRISTDCGEEVDDMLKAMLEVDYNKRPSLNNVASLLQNITLKASRVTPPTYKITNVDGAKKLEIFTLNPNCKIYYTTDGSRPTKSSTLYTGPLVLTKYTSLNAACVSDTDGKVSAPVSIIVPATLGGMKKRTPSPKVTAPDGRLNIEMEAGTEYFYTTDGSTPDRRSAQYTAPVDVDYTTVKKVRVMAVKTGSAYIPSEVVDVNIYPPRLKVPVIHYSFGDVSFDNPNSDGDLYYTLDDSEPSLSSIKYDEPFKIADTSKFVVKVKCILSSGVASETASIRRPSKVLMKK